MSAVGIPSMLIKVISVTITRVMYPGAHHYGGKHY